MRLSRDRYGIDNNIPRMLRHAWRLIEGYPARIALPYLFCAILRTLLV